MKQINQNIKYFKRAKKQTFNKSLTFFQLESLNKPFSSNF